MAWIELHQTLPRHPKLARLANRLRITRAQAAGHLTFLWLWALDFAPTGDISALEPAEISAAADFGGDSELFCQALRQSGWVDADGMIHDWMEYAGRLIGGRMQAKERMKAYREKQKSESVPVKPVPERSENVRVTSTERSELPYSTVPYSTVQNHTTPNQTPPNPPQGVAGAPELIDPAVVTPPAPEKQHGDGKACEVEAFRIRVGSMLRRRPNTAWSEKEMKALRAVLKLNTPEEDILALERRYQTNDKFLRRDVLTLLNNWNGEIDKARNGTSGGSNHPSHGAHGNPRNVGIAGFDQWHADFQARAAAHVNDDPFALEDAVPGVAPEGPEAGRIDPPTDGQTGATR